MNNSETCFSNYQKKDFEKMNRDLLIYGAGGAGRELAFSLSLEKDPTIAWNVLGYVDDTKELRGAIVNDLHVLGGYDWLKENGGNVAVCIVDVPKIKRQLVAKIREIPNINFPLIIGPHCIVASNIEWGEGCIVSLAFNWISPNVKIGDFVFINCTSRIGHDVIIGDYTTVFSGLDIGGATQIGNDCVIGSGVTINPHIKIGNGSVIGGGSVVTKNIPEYVVAAGVPAKVIKEIK
jgi:sugar O-acyltransferase (sialic acid O-acetyltransferase NeuD family)